MSEPHVVHPLKCWTIYFDAIVSGEKTFEVRLDDRGFHTGDALRLQDWNPDRKEYTGREHLVEVRYLLRGSVIAPLIGLPQDIVHHWVVMGIRDAPECPKCGGPDDHQLHCDRVAIAPNGDDR